MREDPAAAEMLDLAVSTLPLAQRAQGMLESLERWLPVEATWLALSDPQSHVYAAVGSTRTARAGCLVSTGPRDGLGVPLIEPGGPYLGMLALLFTTAQRPSAALRDHLGRLTPLIARGVSPVRSLLATACLAHDAAHGAILLADGGVHPFPGLSEHPLLVADAGVVEIARETLAAGQVYRTFLWPLEDGDGSAGHARMTILAATQGPAFVLGALLITPGADCKSLTPRELQVLGLLVHGCSNQQMARRLGVTPRTVAAHMEHLLHKMDVPTRTSAAVRAEREGCYVPPPP